MVDELKPSEGSIEEQFTALADLQRRGLIGAGLIGAALARRLARRTFPPSCRTAAVPTVSLIMSRTLEHRSERTPITGSKSVLPRTARRRFEPCPVLYRNGAPDRIKANTYVVEIAL
jgi:hypothetical protein